MFDTRYQEKNLSYTMNFRSMVKRPLAGVVSSHWRREAGSGITLVSWPLFKIAISVSKREVKGAYTLARQTVREHFVLGCGRRFWLDVIDSRTKSCQIYDEDKGIRR
ncbi:hypothetical protein AVEN_46191-1 [Araneus ventricosus]|uniref:Uncharacterized protein n=1 Tax=Araneus ventricosus TaxID=182803 RepID=A0A4Y2E6B1_ARAVE|nr:hypothetical protein AVEN_46191-1 [Araneus ventricosus]